MPRPGYRRADPRAGDHRRRLAGKLGRKKKRLAVPERIPYTTAKIAPAPERRLPARSVEASPFQPEEGQSGGEAEFDNPNETDLAEMFGGMMPMRDEDQFEDDGAELPDIEVAKKRIPEKTRVLMEELFRAKVDKVQRVNPKKIR